MNVGGITQGERSRWRRRAAAELVRILDHHRDLPVIAWTVGPAGATVVGRVNGLACAGREREVFHTWRSALAFAGYSETATGGRTALLRASDGRDRVLLALVATVFDEAAAS